MMDHQGKGRSCDVAYDVWQSIHDPVTEDMLRGATPCSLRSYTPFYSTSMERKSDAVRKYVCENLSSHDEAFRLLRACVASHPHPHPFQSTRT